MAITQTHLDALETALGKGLLSVEIDGRKVVYQSIGELIKAISYAKQQLAAVAGTATTQSFAQFTRD